ncbi:IS5 family transposase [Nocardia fusca]|uniref:IS5 family transposase n=1 Tax=Nocardia fusca TaxID=941183 RepID=UPI0018DAFE5C|nr:IS5 family transposase [Nocardia fusca]
MTDDQWAVIETLLPAVPNRRLGGRPRVHPRWLLVDTILYVLFTGCACRLVPHNLAPWNTAYKVFAVWTADGTWARVHDELRDRVRDVDGRDPQPSAAVLDSQSVRTHQRGEQIGYDAGKRVAWPQTASTRRHRWVAAACPGAFGLGAGPARCPPGAGRYPGAAPSAGLVWVDGGYVNTVDTSLVGWAAVTEGLEIVAVPRNADVKGFQVLPRRRVVERTFSWLTRCRRLARDYERKTAHAEAMIQVAMIRLMAARLAGEIVEPSGPIETEAARRIAEDLNN